MKLTNCKPMEYRITLDRTIAGHRKKKVDCPYCSHRNTWTRYLDTKTMQYLDSKYGRCDRENSCGAFVMPPLSKDLQPCRIDRGIAEKSLSHYEQNQLALFLSKTFGRDVAPLFRRYRVGTSKTWGGAAVFWQCDRRGQYRSGKIMAYDQDGHREKGKTTWVHSVMGLQDFDLTQCLFGEHLLAEQGKPVAIFESEKTALVYELFNPDSYICLACGSKDGMGGKVINTGKVRPLIGREVVLFADSSADDSTKVHWGHIAKEMRDMGIYAALSDWDNVIAEQHKAQGLDIADLILSLENPWQSLYQTEDPTKEFYMAF